jgi:hypothetical protein
MAFTIKLFIVIIIAVTGKLADTYTLILYLFSRLGAHPLRGDIFYRC